MNLEQYQRIKSKIEVLQRQSDRAAGAMDQLRERLQEEYGVSTPEEAKRLIDAMIGEKEDLQKKLDRMLIEFEKKWRNLILQIND